MPQSFILRGLSFGYDNMDTNDRYINVIKIDDNNKYILHKTTDSKIEFKKIVAGVTNTLATSVQSFNKWQVYNILITVDESIGTTLRVLKNNGMFEKITNVDKTIIKGASSLYLHDSDGTKQPNAFIDSVIYVPGTIWDDATAEAILRGTKEGFSFPELLNTTLSTTQTINVLPNNQYQLKTTQSTTITEMYNNITLKTSTVTANTTFITQPKTNKIKFDITGSFSTMSFKLLM